MSEPMDGGIEMVRFETPKYKCPSCNGIVVRVSGKCPFCGLDFTKQPPTKVEPKGKFRTTLLEP